ncbi:hypothetical protein D9611_001989 [Ephemerocybe angulata]|uniref:Uncharacterized protein n=1 Tax=Ephemerocybe angulata TaxID=980116 RepID=A0A8H5FMS3_9AGAR|nr:hypothetical protein D9611_001989 [Tulosesus angulatus]
MDNTYGRNRQSIADIEDVLYRIFNGHPNSHSNADGEPVIPADALVDVLFSFSDAFNGVPLLSSEEQSMLETLLSNHPDLECTPGILLKFIAQKTAADSPSPPESPADDDTQQLSDRGRSDDRTGGHSRSSSNESNSAYYRGSSRPPSRGPPQTPGGSGKSPFDAASRQRSTPLVAAPPSSWAKRPPAHRRKSDAGNRSDSESGGPPSSFDRRTLRGHGPSNPVSPASSSVDLGTFSPVSSPSPHSRPPSRQHAHSNSGGFASLHYDEHGYSSPDETVHHRRRSIGASGSVNTVPLPRLNPDAGDSDDEESVLGLLTSGRATLESNASMDDLARLDALQRQNEELKKKRAETEDILHKKIAEHEADYADLQANLDQLRMELGATKREEKELRSKERQNMQQISSLEQEVAKLSKQVHSTRETYTRLQKNYAEQCSASETYRDELREKEKKILALEEARSIQDVERDKLEAERHIYEERILRLEEELSSAMSTFSDLDEQKHQNLLLKETIDRMRYDIDELRAQNASNAAGGQTSTSGNESGGNNTLQSELAGKMIWEGDEEQSEGNVSTDTAVEEDDDIEGEEEDVIQTIITRKKRKVASRAAIEKYHQREFEEAKEYSDTGVQYDPTNFAISRSAQTEEPPRILTASFSTQTDPIPEPAPLPPPKVTVTCEMEIQTEPEEEAIASRSPSPRHLESMASSSSTVVPPTPKARLLLDDIDPSLIPLDQPPAYSQITGEEQSHWHIVSEVLKRWHSGATIPVEPVAGGVSEEAVEEWRALKEELGVGCTVIDKIIEGSVRKESSKASGGDKGKGKSRRDRFYNIYNTYVYGNGAGAGGASIASTVLGQAVMVVSASALVMLAMSPYVVPSYGSVPGGATYYDRAAWNSFNSLGAGGEGFGVGVGGGGSAVVWDVLGRIGGGAARIARGWPT